MSWTSSANALIASQREPGGRPDWVRSVPERAVSPLRRFWPDGTPRMNLEGPDGPDEEALYEFGSQEPVAVMAKNGQTYVRGRDGKICRHKTGFEEVRLLRDGRLVAWFCTSCDQHGYYPWKET